METSLQTLPPKRHAKASRFLVFVLTKVVLFANPISIADEWMRTTAAGIYRCIRVSIHKLHCNPRETIEIRAIPYCSQNFTKWPCCLSIASCEYKEGVSHAMITVAHSGY